jgi:hypothetical protein
MIVGDISYAIEYLQNAYTTYVNVVQEHYSIGRKVSFTVNCADEDEPPNNKRVTGTIRHMSANVTLPREFNIFVRIDLDPEFIPLDCSASDPGGKAVMIDILKLDYDITLDS